MSEKSPKGTFKNSEAIYFDFNAKKRISGPAENQEVILPEMPEEAVKEINRDIFENSESQIAYLCELTEKSREKFDAFVRLISSNQYSEGHYRTYINQKKPHRLGSKQGMKKEIPRILSEDEERLYGKIWEYEKEFKKYIDNFLLQREALESELDKTYAHVKNFKGGESLKEKLEKYLEKIDFDFTSFVFIAEDTDGYRKKIEAIEEFTKKLIH